MALKRVRMELARSKEFPDGSANHGYEFNLPLTADDKFDPAAWKADSQLCTVVKFAPREDDSHGQIVHTEDGDWAFSFDRGDWDDEHVFRMEAHTFQPGEYVTVTDAYEEEHVYQVSLVENYHFPKAD